ncbi:hypothetical protein QTN47_03135 [Danxiaibacter flavus]|uniref:Long-chain fatty acid transport protein n=1 Tax=Danxiaibacter flavus TaxID=3049108 RepID=A0ABV3Z9C7_9BACT|nr:hypothetical protein QNM32_03135 [Chitinophagaceae bacterium DXS]
MRFRTFFVCTLGVFSPLVMLAQDAHYWSTDYSAGGFFLPGAAIANNKDSGVYFYNPALIGVSPKSTISINASLYQYESIKIKNGAGTGYDLKSGVASSVPQMLSGSFAFKGKKPVTIAYALIRSPNLSYQATQRRDEKFNVLDDSYSPGSEYFIGQYVTQNLVSETSGQISTGFKLDKHWSVGITMDGNLHKQNYNVTYNARALVNPGGDTTFPIVSNDLYYLANYNNVGLRFKAGVAYDAGKHHLGMIVNTPLIHIAGSGLIVSDYVLNNMKTGDGDYVSLLANSRQENLPVKWKVPMSVGLGYNYDYRKGQIYFAAEYFNKVDEYNIITPRNDYFLRPDTGDNNAITSSLLRLKDVRKSVLNVAVGASYALMPDITGYIALRTDFAYTSPGLFFSLEGFEPYTCYWNNYHLQIGSNIKRQKYNLRAGFSFAYGSSRNYLQEVNFDHPNEDNFLLGDAGQTKATHFSMGFILSYIHNL